eukprot:401570-Prymnesium_polylepis.1
MANDESEPGLVPCGPRPSRPLRARLPTRPDVARPAPKSHSERPKTTASIQPPRLTNKRPAVPVGPPRHHMAVHGHKEVPAQFRWQQSQDQHVEHESAHVVPTLRPTPSRPTPASSCRCAVSAVAACMLLVGLLWHLGALSHSRSATAASPRDAAAPYWGASAKHGDQALADVHAETGSARLQQARVRSSHQQKPASRRPGEAPSKVARVPVVHHPRPA